MKASALHVRREACAGQHDTEQGGNEQSNIPPGVGDSRAGQAWDEQDDMAILLPAKERGQTAGGFSSADNRA